MKLAKSTILNVNVPDEMEISYPLAFMMVLNYPETNGTIEKPKIVISLNRIENYDDLEGKDLLAKFKTNVLEARFKAQESSFEVQSKNECPMYVVHSFTKTTFQKINYDLVYFDALILINDVYCIDFLVNFEKVDEATFVKIYTDIFESLQWEGTVADCAKFFERIDAKVAEMEQRCVDKKGESEAQWVKPIASFQIPSNGKDVFEIGGLDFTIIQDQSSVETTSFSKELEVIIVAQTKKYKKGETILLLDVNDYTDVEEKGLVKISFPILEIYQNGIPTGTFNFEDGKCENPYTNISIEGFEYTLEFCGNVTFEKGWVGINGYLKASYNEEPVFEVKIYKQFDSKTLNWSNYKFKSLEEALQAPKNLVEWLEIQNLTVEVLPEEIFELKNLKSLTVIQKNWDLKLNLKVISERIGELTHLEGLHISNTHIEEIPVSIGNLKNLTSIYLMNNYLKSIPNSILNLPNLLYLNVDNNKLEALSEPINLPSLYSISLSKNLLKTLPESLINQPKINSIKADENPLEHLPVAFNDFLGLELSIEDKKRLLDYEYKGANKNGAVLWNNELFFCGEKDPLYKEFAKVIKKNKLEKYQEALLALTKIAVGFSHSVEEDYSQVGNNRFGGKPDLPVDVPYPTFIHNYEGETEYKYEFVGQVNCETIADLQGYLPRKGMLFFFLETLHNIYGGTNNPCKVMYIEDVEKLASGSRFDFEEADYYEMFELYQGFKVNATSQLSVPAFYSIETNSYLFNEKTESLREIDDYYDILCEHFEEVIQAKFPHDYAINAYGFTQHESPELQASLKLKGNPEDWTILLKVTSTGDMQWGDAGDLFFVIHKSDLAKADFSNVFITMESS